MFFDLTIPHKTLAQEFSSGLSQSSQSSKITQKIPNNFDIQTLINQEYANKIYQCDYSSSPTIVTSSGRFTFTYQEKQQSEVEIRTIEL